MTRTTRAGTTLEPPEEPEPLAMPAEQSIRLENQEGLLPGFQPTGEEQPGEAVPTSHSWFLDLALQNGQLLAEQSVLEHEFGLGTRQVEGGAEGGRGLRQLSPAEVELLEPGQWVGEELDEEGEKQGRRLLERLSKSIKSFYAPLS